jgi:hypothetical protein
MPARGENIADAGREVSATINNPLRPSLYARLQDDPRFHDGITIANEGEEMVANYTVSGAKVELSVDIPGEYYRVNCPYCTDTRKRLWINHRWGQRDEKGQLNLFLAHCYNENCLAQPGNSWRLYREIFTDFSHEVGDVVQKNHRVESADVTPTWPGRHVPLDKMFPNHPANMYLRNRGFDPLLLVRDYQVSYCIEATDDYPLAQGRIIIPSFMEGKLMGWQARYIGDPPSKTIPKYYTMPHMKRNKILYNFDVARHQPYVVLCEGPTDAWRFGPEAVALWGKSISAWQVQLVVGYWKKVYVCLDAEAVVEGKEVFDKLQNKVDKALVRLPGRTDPGSIPTATLRDMVISTPLIVAGE